MSTFAVVRVAGPGWAPAGIFEQPHISEHAAFMNALVDEGLVLLAGPLAGSEAGRARVLLIIDANDEEEIHDRLAGDPWVKTQQLVTETVEPWTTLVGGERLAPTASFPPRITPSNDAREMRAPRAAVRDPTRRSAVARRPTS